MIPGNFQIEEASIREIGNALREGTITCVSLAEKYLGRIEAYDRRGPALKDVIHTNPDALRDAEELDSALREKGPAGPLHGIPALLKDNVETRGMATTSGSLSLSDYLPDEDAFITKRLRAAGALILAKANMHEFAVWGESISSILGQVRNPYDVTRTAGGSSGGTGAGIAANFAAAGIGTDTVNSIRSPASACSCVGIRPTLGLVSRGGICPYSLDQDTAGPICRTVEDAALVLDAIAGSDPDDPLSAGSEGHVPATYTSFLIPSGLEGKRIGILRSLFGDKPVHRDVTAVMEHCLRSLHSGGAIVMEVPFAVDSDYLSSHVSVHLHTFRDDLEAYLQRLGPKSRFHTLNELISSGEIHPGIAENLRRADGLGRNRDSYRIRAWRRHTLRKQVAELMDANSLDALVFPHQKRLAVPTGENQVERNGVLAAVTGFPSMVVPGGFSSPSESAPLGVPAGIEFLGRPWEEGTLISMGYAFEQLTRSRKPPMSTPPLR